jgi:hypothetical protein
MQTTSNLDCDSPENVGSRFEHSPLTRAMLRRHREMLVASAIIVVLAAVLQVHNGEKVALSGLPRLPMPQMCGSKAWFGIECPGCGLTRSFILLAHGDWSGAYQMHRLGWLLALAVLFQFPYRIYALARNESYPLGRRLPKYFGYLLIALLLVNWLCRFF